jgi:hypothetical protein
MMLPIVTPVPMSMFVNPLPALLNVAVSPDPGDTSELQLLPVAQAALPPFPVHDPLVAWAVDRLVSKRTDTKASLFTR